MILAGRRINDGVGARVAQECLRLLMRRGLARPRVTVLGLTFKENITDIRNSTVIDIIHGLQAAGVAVTVCDPYADAEETRRAYGLELVAMEALAPADAVIFAVPHREFLDGGWALATQCLAGGVGVVMDVKSRLDPDAAPPGVDLWRL